MPAVNSAPVNVTTTGAAVKITPSGSTATAILATKKADWQVKNKPVEHGPYFGDGGVTYSDFGGQMVEGTFEFTVLIGQDAGQAAALAATMARLHCGLLITDGSSTATPATNGFTLTITSATITDAKVTNETEKVSTITASFRNNGAFTYA
jgi:hypothetical protein